MNISLPLKNCWSVFVLFSLCISKNFVITALNRFYFCHCEQFRAIQWISTSSQKTIRWNPDVLLNFWMCRVSIDYIAPVYLVQWRYFPMGIQIKSNTNLLVEELKAMSGRLGGHDYGWSWSLHGGRSPGRESVTTDLISVPASEIDFLL